MRGESRGVEDEMGCGNHGLEWWRGQREVMMEKGNLISESNKQRLQMIVRRAMTLNVGGSNTFG